MNNKHQKCLLRTQIYSVPQIKKSFEVILDFFFKFTRQYSLFKSTMLPQIRHIIVNMFSSILEVTVKT